MSLKILFYFAFFTILVSYADQRIIEIYGFNNYKSLNYQLLKKFTDSGPDLAVISSIYVNSDNSSLYQYVDQNTWWPYNKIQIVLGFRVNSINNSDLKFIYFDETSDESFTELRIKVSIFINDGLKKNA